MMKNDVVFAIKSVLKTSRVALMTTLNTHNLTLGFGNRTFVENLSMQFQPGQVWGIFGPNGAGKTTLLHALAGLHVANTGNVSLDEKFIHQIKPKDRAKKIGVLLQDTDFPFPSTVLDAAMIGRFPYQRHWFYDHEDDKYAVMEALRHVDLHDFIDRDVQTLSGGEKRRLSLATLLAQDPDIFLLDEPTNHLDIEQQLQLFEIIKHQAREFNKTIIMILHDLPFIKRYCEKLIVFDYLKEFSFGPCSEMLAKLKQLKPNLFYI